MGYAVCFFQAEDGIRDFCRSRGLGEVYKGQVDALVRSAIGSANFYETRRLVAKDAKDQWANEYRDQDRMGVDGGPNRVDFARRIAAENAVKAYSLVCIAEGACLAYRELMGAEWAAYQNTRNKQPIDAKASALMDDALGI